MEKIMKTLIGTILVFILAGCSTAPSYSSGKPKTALSRCISGNCVNGHGTYAYEGNYRYVGNFLDSLRHGQGVFFFPDGEEYSGNWNADRLDGKCAKREKTGISYSGTCEQKGETLYFSVEKKTEKKSALDFTVKNKPEGRSVLKKKARDILNGINAL